MGTAFVVLVLLALCGFIAYVGDLLGRRLGKKRLSVFGLRPKHTAILLTVVTGVVIAGVTFGAATASVPWFRRVVTEGEKLAGQNQRLASKNRLLEGQNQHLARENQELLPANDRLRAENGALQSTSRKLGETNRRLASANIGLQQQNGALRGQNERLSSANQQLHRGNEALKQQNGQLESRNSALSAQNRSLAAQSVALTTKNHKLSSEVGGLRAEQGRLTSQVADLHQVANSYRAEQYIFRRGYEFGRRVFPPNPPREVLQDTIAGLVYDVEHDLEGRADPALHNVWAKPLPFQWVPPTGYRAAAGGRDDYLRWVVGAARRERNVPLMVRVVADENCVMGRVIPLRLDWYPNEPVFHHGDVITQVRLNGADTEGLLLGRVIYFLQTDVRRAATTGSHAMLPTAEELGHLDYDDVLRVCHRLRQIGGQAVVKAVARKDTYRAGPLYLDLEVDPVST